MDIHVGNLSRELGETELRQEFEKFGRVVAIRLVKDRHSGVSRGFGFVEMAERDEGLAAIQGLNGQELAGRTMDVSEARPSGGGKKGGGRPYGGNRGGSKGGGKRGKSRGVGRGGISRGGRW